MTAPDPTAPAAPPGGAALGAYLAVLLNRDNARDALLADLHRYGEPQDPRVRTGDVVVALLVEIDRLRARAAPPTPAPAVEDGMDARVRELEDVLREAHAALRVQVPGSEEGYSGRRRAEARAAIEATGVYDPILTAPGAADARAREDAERYRVLRYIAVTESALWRALDCGDGRFTEAEWESLFDGIPASVVDAARRAAGEVDRG